MLIRTRVSFRNLAWSTTIANISVFMYSSTFKEPHYRDPCVTVWQNIHIYLYFLVTLFFFKWPIYKYIYTCNILQPEQKHKTHCWCNAANLLLRFIITSKGMKSIRYRCMASCYKQAQWHNMEVSWQQPTHGESRWWWMDADEDRGRPTAAGDEHGLPLSWHLFFHLHKFANLTREMRRWCGAYERAVSGQDGQSAGLSTRV